MIKTYCLIFSFVCFYYACFAQVKGSSNYGVILTKIDSKDTGIDTAQLLYCRNSTGDRLAVYTIRNGVVSEATAYYITATSHDLYFYSKSLLAGQLIKDSLHIAFEDKTHAVIINNRDRYILFPAYYTRFKKQVKVKHSMMALLDLLSDAIGDYSIADVLPLLIYTPKLGHRIRQARIITQRSQADMQDIWSCKYFYNRQNELDSVNARSSEEIRFSKKVHYNSNKAYSISTYLNIEDRQVTSRRISYGPRHRSPVKWQESYVEIGKNRETTSLITFIWHDLGMLRKLEPSNAEVLQMLKPTKGHNYTKKHIN